MMVWTPARFSYGLADGWPNDDVVIFDHEKREEGPRMEATRIGIDVAKNFFHLVAMDDRGKVVWRKALTRGRVLECRTQLKPCIIGMEACATAHYWARELQQLGHEVRLRHPRFAAA
jgi:hypothetical protein